MRPQITFFLDEDKITRQCTGRIKYIKTPTKVELEIEVILRYYIRTEGHLWWRRSWKEPAYRWVHEKEIIIRDEYIHECAVPELHDY